MTTNRNKYTGYLLVHFIGEAPDEEQVYFSCSKDGLYWKDLNGGKPVLHSNIGQKGVRDPFLVRSPIEGKFFLIATDLRIANGKGWLAASNTGSKDIIVWESKNLIDWSPPWSVTLGIMEAGSVWAPEAIYDEAADEFLVFWASSTEDPQQQERKHKIYSSRTRDFHNFTPTELYIERENHIIDTTIIAHNGMYYRYSKDETTKNIKVEQGLSLDRYAFSPINSPILDQLVGVEGPEIYKFNDREEWCLIVDRFASGKGYLPLITTNLASGDFKIVPVESFNLGKTIKRHGGVLSITTDEYTCLLEAFDGQTLETEFI